MDNPAAGKNIRRFAKHSRLAGPHRTGDDEQRFRTPSDVLMLIGKTITEVTVRTILDQGNLRVAHAKNSYSGSTHRSLTFPALATTARPGTPGKDGAGSFGMILMRSTSEYLAAQERAGNQCR
jgi:hypothetical protein